MAYEIGDLLTIAHSDYFDYGEKVVIVAIEDEGDDEKYPIPYYCVPYSDFREDKDPFTYKCAYWLADREFQESQSNYEIF